MEHFKRKKPLQESGAVFTKILDLFFGKFLHFYITKKPSHRDTLLFNYFYIRHAPTLQYTEFFCINFLMKKSVLTLCKNLFEFGA